jgi:membrane associated rhomboid family serine protease
MGFYDRDYYRDPARRNPFAALRGWSITTWLIAINVAVFLIDGMLKPRNMADMMSAIAAGRDPSMSILGYWGHFSLGLAVYKVQIWRFITFQFLHSGTWHLAGNMLSLYFFGAMVESYFGSRRFLLFYLLCGIAGAGSYVLLWAGGGWVSGPMGGLFVTNPYVPMVGASAGIFGVLVAAAWMAPDQQVMLLFPPIPLKLKTLAWIMMGLAAYTVFSQGKNAGGEAAHLGGGVLGLILMANQHWLNPFARKRRTKGLRIQKDWSKDLNR